MNVTAILILMITFFALIFLGFHISYSMMASAAVTILYLGLSPTQVVNTMVDELMVLHFWQFHFSFYLEILWLMEEFRTD